MIRAALISVYDKQGIVPFAQGLARHGVRLISTGNTYQVLKEAGLDVIPVSEYTGFPEILGGRVKTLHPKIHGGILARRDIESDLDALAAHGIDPIDLVVVNLYPFVATAQRKDATHQEVVEMIDIGGPAMIRGRGEKLPGRLGGGRPRALR